MARRQLGHGRGGRMKIERDRAEVTAGVRHGRTLGGPIALQVANRDYANWEERMNPWPVEAEVPEVHLPRPGHADLVGTWKYGLTDVRNVLERASARETAARVAGGALCQGVPARARRRGPLARRADRHRPRARARRAADASRTSPASTTTPCAASTPRRAARWSQHINVQRKANESIGGVFEVIAFGLVPGLGSHVSWEERLDGRLAGALCSIQAVKGVALGDGFDLAGRPGSQAHDEIFYGEERGYYRETNRAGGLEGGMTTGEPLVVRAAMKPLPTLTKPLRSVDIATQRARRRRCASAPTPCTVPAAGVVGEAMVAFVLADAYREKFGGDHIDDVARGASRLRGADRVAAALKPALVFIGFMGAGKSTAAREAAAALGVRGRRHRRAARGASSASPIEAFFDRDGRGGVPRARGGARRARCSSAPTAA